LRLDPRVRLALYGVVAALFVTGAVWLVADQLKDTASSEAWQQLAATLLMCHGGAAMAMLMFLGALIPLHVVRAWRARKNRVTGTLMASLDAVLVATAFGLYYVASPTLRPWMSGLHIGFGLAMPLLFLVHVVTGRRRSAAANAIESQSS